MSIDLFKLPCNFVSSTFFIKISLSDGNISLNEMMLAFDSEIPVKHRQGIAFINFYSKELSFEFTISNTLLVKALQAIHQSLL